MVKPLAAPKRTNKVRRNGVSVKRHVVILIVIALAGMVAWVGYLTYEVYTFPTIASMIGDRNVVVVQNKGNFYYILSERALKEPITITDSKGTVYYVLSRERLKAIGPRAVMEGLIDP